ncbi:hypothetical protein MPSEU_001062100 [Mayamaea pseudoterrestris]|nr:hypothetical protein MPSEU_001062100 [Mayamaea pseudoterrestris]
MLDAVVLTNDSANLPLVAPVSPEADEDYDDEDNFDLHKESLSPMRTRLPLMKMQTTPATISSALSSSMSVSSPMEASVSKERNAQPILIRVPPPSPRRPRLDPRYAARLAAGTRSMMFSTRASESELLLPPGITRDRDSSIFRPTSIVSCDDDGQCSPMDLSLEHQQSPVKTDAPPQYSKFFAPTLPFARSDSLDSHVAGASRVNSSPSSSMSMSSMDYGASDRFIPSRATSSFNFNLWSRTSSSSGTDSTTSGNTSNDNASPADDQDDAEDSASNPTTTGAPSQQLLLNNLLRSELLRENEVSSSLSHSSFQQNGLMARGNAGNSFRFQSPRQLYQENIFPEALGPTAVVNAFSLMPAASAASQRLLAVPCKRKRRISKVPFKVLDAPALQDDFYLNLVDWSSLNVLAVGLGSCVYLWSASTSKVTKLCDLAESEDLVTSVSWAQRGTHLAVGTNRGEVHLWDTVKCKRIRTMPGHTARIGALAWTGPMLASGSRDRLIYLRDVRSQHAFTHQLTNHKQEVCGLKWSYDEPAFLASGGNDNHLHVIDSRNPQLPLHQFTEHTAAVKAIAWSPHQHGLLASGGGTADRCIRFFNTLSGASLNKIDTGSQVCNLAWSNNVNEIVSTHGYSLNQIVVWRYPSMSKVATLTGHTYRVLYLAISPDGSTIVTGAGDETLRFWQVFPGPQSSGKEGTGGLLFPQTIGSVIR